jgi:hypothetical protein
MIYDQPGVPLDEIEKQAILNRLKFFRGNKVHTARDLGIVVRTLDSKLEKYVGTPHVDRTAFDLNVTPEPAPAIPPAPVPTPASKHEKKSHRA